VGLPSIGRAAKQKSLETSKVLEVKPSTEVEKDQETWRTNKTSTQVPQYKEAKTAEQISRGSADEG
jgi:hypothetical protein